MVCLRCAFVTFVLYVSAVYTLSLDDIRSVAPGCSAEMSRTVQKLDIEVGTNV